MNGTRQPHNKCYLKIDITTDGLREQEVIERSGRLFVSQIFIDGEGIGGYDDLASQSDSGELDQLLGLASPSAVREAFKKYDARNATYKYS